MRSDHLHVGMGVGHAGAKLFETLVDDERGEAAYERNLAGIGHAGADSHHVCLGDPAGNEPVGKLLLKISSHRGFGQIRVQHHDVLVFAADLHERAAESFARRGAEFDLELRLGGHAYCSSCSASLTSSGVGATPWNLGLFSMKDTPLPLMVCATMQVGLPLVASASFRAA